TLARGVQVKSQQSGSSLQSALKATSTTVKEARPWVTGRLLPPIRPRTTTGWPSSTSFLASITPQALAGSAARRYLLAVAAQSGARAELSGDSPPVQPESKAANERNAHFFVCSFMN